MRVNADPMKHELTITFDDFGWEGLSSEAARQGIAVEELVLHAAMYYLSDLHTGRAAVQILQRADEAEAGEGGGPPERPARPRRFS